MKKNLALSLMIVWSFSLLFSACAFLFSDDIIHRDETYSTIQKRFESDYELISEAVQNELYDDVAALKWVHSTRTHEKCVEFNCCSRGMGNRSTYAGFFYTPSDDPLAMWRHDIEAVFSVTPDDFTETVDGWEYQENDSKRDGSTVFIVRKLAPDYYYYHLRY
ncbi:MAG: hypothetical protein IIY70_00905 [Oscillospiraceae bacterium]|nr:hypothetical protein [Oscillospiraceae bacterium]